MNSTELRLVVAIRLRRWRQRLLGLPLLRLVLSDQTPHERVHLGTTVFQLQLPRLYGLWIIDGYCGVFDGVLLREAYIWVRGSFLQFYPC